jgi:nitric oxide reductase large subunit
MNQKSAAVAGRVAFAGMMVVSLWVAAPQMTDVPEVIYWLRAGGAIVFLGSVLIAATAMRAR